MAQRFANSFAAETPYGVGLQNIAAALFGGKSPIDREYQEARTMSQLTASEQHMAAADASRALATERTAGTDHFRNIRTADSEDQDAAFATSRPLPKVRAVRQFLMTGERPSDVTDDDVRVIGNFLVTRRAAYGDRTVDPNQMQQGVRTGLQTQEWMRALTDPTAMRPFARAQNALAGRGEFDNMEGGVFNRFDGGQTLNTIGDALVGKHNATASKERAHAGKYGAETRQIDLETRTGVKVGAPVIVNDPEAGSIYTSPLSAPGRAPGARPTPPKATAASGGLKQSDIVYTRGENNSVVAVSVAEAVEKKLPIVGRPGAQRPLTTNQLVYTKDGAGQIIAVPAEEATANGYEIVAAPRAFAPKNAPQRRALSKVQSEQIVGALETLTETKASDMDPQLRTAVVSRATQFASDPNSEFHQDPVGATTAALKEVAPEGVEKSGIYGFRTTGAKGGARSGQKTKPITAAPAAGSPQPQAAATDGELPPAARAKLKEGVVTTFGNGQSWTLQNGKPVRMQ
jgi:hypothetical protein